MRVLSLSRPWPWIMLHPDPAVRKMIENRTWAPPVEQIGKTIALHSANSWDKPAFDFFQRIGVTDYPSRFDLYPSGVILGVTTIDRVRTGSPDNLPKDIAANQKRYFFGPFGWYLVDSVALLDPIPLKGGQGLRNLPPAEDRLVVDACARLGRVIT